MPPTTLEGIERYLGAGMVKGIGPHFARKLVQAFGAEVFEVIAQTPQRLQELDGIGPKRTARVVVAWAEQQVIRTIMELSRPLKKTPVLANVCYGFIGNRMMEGYAREAERMVLEGAPPRQVDSALEQWGMAMGILAVFDMAGIDVGVNVHKANADRYPPDATYYQADFALVEAGRLGQKNGKGYYRYAAGDRTRHDDPEAGAVLRARATELQVPQRRHSADEIVERCIYPLINEGFRILEERVALRSADVDVVWTSGYGFPRYRGGPMFHAETLGLETVLAGIEKYRTIFGPMHWQPAPLLVELVRSGRSVADWEHSS